MKSKPLDYLLNILHYLYSSPLRPRVVCADGTSLSVQASSDHYCTPQINNGTYTHVEVGFLKDPDGNVVTPPESWRQYGEGTFPSDVYRYIPLTLVMEFITEHGGKL